MPRRMVLCTISGIALSLAWAALPFGTKLDQWVLGVISSHHGSRTPPSELILIGLDDLTFKELNASPRQPFPRKHFATALENIVSAKPKLVILDLLAFQESDDEESNARIERALRKVPTTIARGISEQGQGNVSDTEILSDSRFRKAAARELSMILVLDQSAIWNLSTKPFAELAHEEHFPLREPLITYAGLSAPLPDSRSLINYYGPPGTIPRVSLHELVRNPGSDLLASLNDKVVFVGFQSVARMRGQLNQEQFPVPVSIEPMYGVEIHANAAGNLLDGSWLRRMSLRSEMLLLALTVSILMFVALALPLTLSWIVLLGFALGWGFATYLSVTSLNFFLPGLMMLVIGFGLVFGPISLVRALEEFKKGKLIRKQLGIDTP